MHQVLLSICLASVTTLSAAPATDPLTATAEKIAAQITAKPEKIERLYATEFLRAVPAPQLVALYQSLHAKYGAVIRVVPTGRTSAQEGKFNFLCRDAQMPVTLSIDSSSEHRVVGLWFGPATPRINALKDVTARLAKLPGKVSFQIQRLDDGRVLHAHQADTPLAIGSTFKLYILATLMEQKVPWDRVVRLEERFKSLPSGALRDWPEGSPLTVHTLAMEMISKSDNTATDHLLALAGRQRVEAMLPALGVKNPAANVPFLSTLEMFRIKADASLLRAYLAADAAGRRGLLDQRLGKPRPDASELGMSKPVAIDQVEWFASADDLCRVMRWFDRKNDPVALGILALNPGLAVPRDRFPYAGYKGGSETGVLNMTWLLRAKSGRHYAVSGGWNDPAKAVDEEQFFGLMQTVLNILDEPATSAPVSRP